MSEFDHRPLNEDFEAEQNVEAPTMLEMENLEQDLKGAIETEGADTVQDAIAQVANRTAPPEALMAWIDEMRDPEIHPAQDLEPATGFIHDFEADTVKAGGTLAVHDEAGDDVPAADKTPGTGGGDDDDDASDYLFSATRRRRAEDEEDDEGSPAGEGGDKVKPAATTKAPKPSSSNKP